MDRHFTYDAENRQASFTTNNNPSTYTYDGNGLRVSKTSGLTTTVYVYDASGNLAAEYSSAAGMSSCATNTCYAVLDHLGSTRMLTDANGSSTVTRYDYLPFGQELLASTNGRTAAMGYFANPDLMNPKFTGKNRDQETSLDWFEVRHMSGAQGRFQSPDPGNVGANLGDPQTWNAYSYVGNNPLSYTDPSGNSWFSVMAGIFAGIGTFLSTGNPLAAAQVGAQVAGTFDTFESVVNGRVPGSDLFGFGSSSGVGSLTGCGPLGNCGMLGNGPWTEQWPGSNGFFPGLIPVAAGASGVNVLLGGGAVAACAASIVCGTAVVVGVAAVGTGIYLYKKGEDRRAAPAEKHTPQGAVENELDLEKAQADARKGKGAPIDDTNRSKQNRKHKLGKIGSLQDALDEFGK